MDGTSHVFCEGNFFSEGGTSLKKTWPPYCINPLQESFLNVSQNEK
jgi:hypothetical protein